MEWLNRKRAVEPVTRVTLSRCLEGRPNKRFEMFSSYVVDPANSAVRKTIESAVESIEAAAAEAVITAADAVDYSFLLQLQD